MKTIVILGIMLILGVAMMGCTTDRHDSFIVKDKFSASNRCGGGSSTLYYILDTSGVVHNIADSCTSGGVGMNNYHVWADAKPGDTIII